MISDRRLRSDEQPARAIMFAWFAIAVLLTSVAWPKLAQGRMPDPDDYLRLAQVRDVLAGQGWYDLHQYRITPPDGVLMHWSRIVDVPLYLSIRLLEPLVGQAMAEQITAFTIPLLIFGLICLVIGRLAWRMFDVETAVFSCLALGLSPFVVAQVQPLRIDHHAYQILAVAVAAWALSWRPALRGGAAAGAAMGIGAMISLETLPMAAGFGLVLFIRWLRNHQLRWWLVGYMKSLALTLAIVFAATRGLPDLAEHCDVISPAHIGFFVITALATGAIATLQNPPRLALIVLFAIAGAAGLAFFAMSAPQCLEAPFGSLDPLLREHWFMKVKEGLPIWNQKLDIAIPAMVQSAVALIASIVIFARQRDWQRQWWLEYTILLVVALLAAVMTLRSFGFVGVLGAIPMGWLAQQFFLQFRKAEGIGKKLLGVLLMYLVLVPSTPFTFIKGLGEDSSNERKTVGTRDSDCNFKPNIARLDRLPPARLFAIFDIGPTVLHSTHHAVIATSHHRAQQAMRDVIVGFTSPPEQSRAIVDRYGANYVVACMDLAEPRNYIELGGEKGLMARLKAGDPPDWLKPVEVGGDEYLKVWKVQRH